MAEQFTTMELNVDLQCSKCYNKVKKILCKYPEIRDQIYDWKQNKVTIKVLYCCPEKMKQKIRSEGGKSIKSIEIKPNKKKRKVTFGPLPVRRKPQPKPSQPAPKTPDHTTVHQRVFQIPFGEPFLQQQQQQQLVYGIPAPCYDGHYGRPVYDSWGNGGCNGGYYDGSRDYFSEENPAACKIM